MNRTAEETAALIALAETFESARNQANAIASTSWQLGAYGDASHGINKVLVLLTESEQEADEVYQVILDGQSVREALEYVRKNYAPAPDEDAEEDAPQDHLFRVVNGRSGAVVLETRSWYEAADCQYENNRQETAVGYDPCFGMWLVDNDGTAVQVQTQL